MSPPLRQCVCPNWDTVGTDDYHGRALGLLRHKIGHALATAGATLVDYAVAVHQHPENGVTNEQCAPPPPKMQAPSTAKATALVVLQSPSVI